MFRVNKKMPYDCSKTGDSHLNKKYREAENRIQSEHTLQEYNDQKQLSNNLTMYETVQDDIIKKPEIDKIKDGNFDTSITLLG